MQHGIMYKDMQPCIDQHVQSNRYSATVSRLASTVVTIYCASQDSAATHAWYTLSSRNHYLSPHSDAFGDIQGKDELYLAVKTVSTHWSTWLMILWSRMCIHCLGRLALPLLRGATHSRTWAIPVTTH